MSLCASKGSVEYKTWGDVRERITVVNPRLAQAIDRIDPDDSFKLINVKYPYGRHILETREIVRTQ